MSDLEAFYIPKTLDAPTRWLFWSVDDALAMMIPFWFGVFLHHVGIGTIVALSAFILWRRIKGRNGVQYFRYMAYWYLPLKLKKTPPSHNRIFLG